MLLICLDLLYDPKCHKILHINFESIDMEISSFQKMAFSDKYDFSI